MFAVEKSPTVHPARVNGTHGAGVARSGVPLAGTVSEYVIDGAWSTVLGAGTEGLVSMTGEVQYVNEAAVSVVPSGL
jgi:hypothetical protein